MIILINYFLKIPPQWNNPIYSIMKFKWNAHEIWFASLKL